MIPEIDVWRVANLMLKRYGEEADIESAIRAEELAEAGDRAGEAVWRRITDAIGQLENTTPPRTGALTGEQGRFHVCTHEDAFCSVLILDCRWPISPRRSWPGSLASFKNSGQKDGIAGHPFSARSCPAISAAPGWYRQSQRCDGGPSARHRGRIGIPREALYRTLGRSKPKDS